MGDFPNELLMVEIQKKKPFHIHLSALYHLAASLEKPSLSFGSFVLAGGITRIYIYIKKAAADLSKRTLCVIAKAEKSLIWKLERA